MAQYKFVESCTGCLGNGQVSMVEMGSVAHVAKRGYPGQTPSE